MISRIGTFGLPGRDEGLGRANERGAGAAPCAVPGGWARRRLLGHACAPPLVGHRPDRSTRPSALTNSSESRLTDGMLVSDDFVSNWRERSMIDQHDPHTGLHSEQGALRGRAPGAGARTRSSRCTTWPGWSSRSRTSSGPSCSPAPSASRRRCAPQTSCTCAARDPGSPCVLIRRGPAVAVRRAGLPGRRRDATCCGSRTPPADGRHAAGEPGRDHGRPDRPERDAGPRGRRTRTSCPRCPRSRR